MQENAKNSETASISLTDSIPARCQRNAELTCGQIRVELAVDLGQQTARQAVRPCDCLNARGAQFDESELGRDEKPVQRDEQQGTN
jgi:hypothetical protein